LSALIDRGDLAFSHPLAVTHERIIIDGYVRWELAQRQGMVTLECIEYRMSSEEALGELIRTHRPCLGLTDFVRIELALDLEPYFREKALMNQQAGGQDKGLSKLTEAQQVDTRREIARLAGVGAGNVRKVKNILTHASPPLLEAAKTAEVSINLAEKWSHEPYDRQKEFLRLHRINRGIEKKARQFVSRHLSQRSKTTPNPQVIKLPELIELLNDANLVNVEIIDAPGMAIFVTRELINALTPPQAVLV